MLRTSLFTMIALLGIAFTADAALFDDTATGDWTTPATWTAGSGSPASGDHVIKDDGGVDVTVSSDQSFGDAANASTFNAGTFTINAGQTLTHVAGSTVNSTGAVTWAGGGTFANAGTLDWSTSAGLALTAPGFTFSNTGTFEKTSPSYHGLTVSGASGGGVFTSTGGDITNTGGNNFRFENVYDGPAWSISGSQLNASLAGSTISFRGVWSEISGAANGEGSVTLRDNGGSSNNNLFADSTLGLTLNVTGAGLLGDVPSYRTATIDANGATVTNDGIIKTLSGKGKFEVRNGTFVNNGQVYAQDTMFRVGPQGSPGLAATNAASGTIYLNNATGSTQNLLYIGSQSSLINDGTIVKQGADEVKINSESWGKGPLTNNGTIRVEEGSLHLEKLTLTFDSNGTFEFVLEDLAGQTEGLRLGENVSLDGTVTAIDNGMDLGVWYTVITMDSGRSLTDAGLIAGANTLINVVDGADGFVQVQLIPEPASLALMGLGGLLIARRRAS